MSENYYIVNENYEFGCSDSLMADVSLSKLTSACLTVIKNEKVKINNKKAIMGITIIVTPATGIITTSLIDGIAVTFVSATGNIQGSSVKINSLKQKFCLADSKINGLNVSTYIGKGSIGTLTVVGTNTSSGATVTDVCKFWFKNAGQSVVKGN